MPNCETKIYLLFAYSCKRLAIIVSGIVWQLKFTFILKFAEIQIIVFQAISKECAPIVVLQKCNAPF